MTGSIKTVAAAGALLAMSSVAALAANAVTVEPANVHANRTGSSTVINTIQAAETIDATNCRNGWCAAAGGYVRSSKFRFARAGRGGSSAASKGYDYNVPLALPPYGIRRHSGLWRRRYYDKFGNYTKYGQQP